MCAFLADEADGPSTVKQLMDRGVSIRILNIGGGQCFDNSPMGQLLFTMLVAFAQLERSFILERTAAGKAIAKTKAGFHEGRPALPKARIKAAMDLLEHHSYREVVEMIGISKATLQRYKSKMQ